MNVRRKLKNMLGDNELKDYVINYFLQEDNIKQSMEDLQKHGCQSGVRIDIWTHLMRGCIIDYVH